LGEFGVVNRISELWKNRCLCGATLSSFAGRSLLRNIPNRHSAIITSSNQKLLRFKGITGNTRNGVGMIASFLGLQDNLAADLKIPKSYSAILMPSGNKAAAGKEGHAAEFTLFWRLQEVHHVHLL